MKKFLAISAIVGLAGIGFGIVQRQDPSPATVEAAGETTTTTTTAAAVAVVPTRPSASSPTRKAVVAKATTATTAKPSTPTTARRASVPVAVPTTATTSLPVATTMATTGTTPTTLPASPPPTCTITADKASVARGDTQVLRLTSNLAGTPVRVTAIYPGNPQTSGKIPQQFVYSATTDAAGSDVWDPVNNPGNSTGLVRVSVNFYPVGAKQIGSLCTTSFQAV